METTAEKKSTPNVAGFESWLAMFEHIKTHKLQNEDRISLVWSESVRQDGLQYPDDMVLDMNVVRAQCFNELYDALPLPATMGFLLHVIDGSTMSDGDKKILVDFLKKLPTRTHG